MTLTSIAEACALHVFCKQTNEYLNKLKMGALAEVDNALNMQCE